MDETSYNLIGSSESGNRVQDVKNPSLGWIIAFVFTVSFVGIFSLVPLRKVHDDVLIIPKPLVLHYLHALFDCWPNIVWPKSWVHVRLQIMVIDYKLTYPSGTATAILINSFHTTRGAEIARSIKCCIYI